MIGTVTDVLGIGRRLLFAAFALAAAVALLAIVAASAQAHAGHYHDIYNHNNADADAKVFWLSDGRQALDIVIDARYSRAAWVQYRPYKSGYTYSWQKT